MSDKAKKILRLYGESRKRIMRLTELNDEIEILKVALYEPSTAKIKEEHELGSSGFNNAYKTPKLAQMERMDVVVSEKNKLQSTIDKLMFYLESMDYDTQYIINECYISNNVKLGEVARIQGITRYWLYKKLIKEIERVYTL